MNETLKKYKEYIGLAVFFVPLIFGIFKYTSVYMDLPGKVEELKQEIRLIKRKNRYQDSVNVIQSQFLAQDYDALVKAGIMK